MAQIKFIKEPGYIYNLFTIITAYFNASHYEKEPLGYQYAVEDAEYFKNVIKPYSPISDDLLLFFYMKDDKTAFMTKYYFDDEGMNLLQDNFGLSKIQKDLSNYGQVIDNLYRFYFEDITDEKIAECKGSSIVLNNSIRMTNYNDRVKAAMYSFFIEPIPVIQKLSYELMTKEFILKQEYEKCLKEVSDFQVETTAQDIEKVLSCLDVAEYEYNHYNEIYVSIGPNLRQVVYSYDYPGNVLLLIVGLDLKRYTEYKNNQLSASELDVFGGVLSEKNRLRILAFIGQRKEATIKEIEKELDLTATNSYYHLAYMIRIGMLKTRNKGRTIIYSINDAYFIRVISTLQGYLSIKKEGK